MSSLIPNWVAFQDKTNLRLSNFIRLQLDCACYQTGIKSNLTISKINIIFTPFVTSSLIVLLYLGYNNYTKLVQLGMYHVDQPTLSLGINLSSDPCLRKISPAVCDGLMPTPSSVMMALVSGEDLNCSAANLTTAVKGVESGTLKILYGNFGSDVRVILNETFVWDGAFVAGLDMTKFLLLIEW